MYDTLYFCFYESAVQTDVGTHLELKRFFDKSVTTVSVSMVFEINMLNITWSHMKI